MSINGVIRVEMIIMQNKALLLINQLTQQVNSYTRTTLGYDQGIAGRDFEGKIKEIIYLETVPSEADQLRVEGYLAWKWGTKHGLPGSHPYKTMAP